MLSLSLLFADCTTALFPPQVMQALNVRTCLCNGKTPCSTNFGFYEREESCILTSHIENHNPLYQRKSTHLFSFPHKKCVAPNNRTVECRKNPYDFPLYCRIPSSHKRTQNGRKFSSQETPQTGNSNDLSFLLPLDSAMFFLARN